MKISFEVVGFSKIKSGVCVVCGKRGKINERFEQTINPWNQKTRKQIYDEELVKARKWAQIPFIHRSCEREYYKSSGKGEK